MNINYTKYGLLRLEYLKNHNKALYQTLLMKDQLNEHLFSISIEIENKENTLTNKLMENDRKINENFITNHLQMYNKIV